MTMTNGQDWRSIDNDKEKYAAYMCSREWSVLKEAVRERAHGKCERCRVLPIDATHHLTYARKYNEHLEDLQGNCNHCHNFTHGKSEFDPKANAAVISYMNGCKADGVMAAPLEMLVGVIPPLMLNDKYAPTAIAVAAVWESLKKVVEFERMVPWDDWAYHLGPVVKQLLSLVREIELVGSLPFAIPQFEVSDSISIQEYETAASIVGIGIIGRNDIVAFHFQGDD
jgi:hypothetical protein